MCLVSLGAIAVQESPVHCASKRASAASTTSQENFGTTSKPFPQRNRDSRASANGVATVNAKRSPLGEPVRPMVAPKEIEQSSGSDGNERRSRTARSKDFQSGIR